METTIGILIGTAISVGFIHTLIGIDHSLPFVVLGRAQGWSLGRVLALTAACGVGHVVSSIALGAVGIFLGSRLSTLQWIEASRGELAAWGLIVFGLVYAGWSFARQRRRQRHAHEHAGGHVHTHEHDTAQHDHSSINARTVTAWSLFVIFVLGPCEPLIPLLLVPALDLGIGAAVPVVLAFAVTTIGTMLVVVSLGYVGLRMRVFRRFERHAQTLAGLAIASSGVVIQMLGI